MKIKKSIAIIGGGAAALMLASHIDTNKYDVTIYERNNAVGRKLLVAGDGGFNLTHSEELEQFISRYIPSSFLEKSIRSFTNTDVQQWLKSIGIETYIGTSKRVFPIKGIKPIDVLNAILNVLKQNNVIIKTLHTWAGWNNNNELLFQINNETIAVKTDITVFALGGASWKVTGSDGGWCAFFNKAGINTLPFQASNCAVKINWEKDFIEIAEGTSLKNISLEMNGTAKKGELVITKFGLEGGAIYALIASIREQLNEIKSATVFLDLKPNVTLNDIKNKLKSRGNNSISKVLETELKFNETNILLLKTILSKLEYTYSTILAEKIKHLPFNITALAPIDEAISTVGGIPLNEIDEYFQLKQLPNHFCIGEMLDWDAPTGGYLLQACFSMGYFLAKKLNA